MQTTTTDSLAVLGSMPPPRATASCGLTLRPYLPLGPPSSSSSHSWPFYSPLSPPDSTADRSSSCAGSDTVTDTMATKCGEICEALLDAEGEVPVSQEQR